MMPASWASEQNPKLPDAVIAPGSTIASLRELSQETVSLTGWDSFLWSGSNHPSAVPKILRALSLSYKQGLLSVQAKDTRIQRPWKRVGKAG